MLFRQLLGILVVQKGKLHDKNSTETTVRVRIFSSIKNIFLASREIAKESRAEIFRK